MLQNQCQVLCAGTCYLYPLENILERFCKIHNNNNNSFNHSIGIFEYFLGSYECAQDESTVHCPGCLGSHSTGCTQEMIGKAKERKKRTCELMRQLSPWEV